MSNIKKAITAYLTQVYDLDKNISLIDVKKAFENTDFSNKIDNILDIKFNPEHKFSLAERLKKVNEIEIATENYSEEYIVNLVKNEIQRLNIFNSKNNTLIFKRLHQNHNIFDKKPYSETFVYSEDFEGIHIRSEQIARGGFRNSDIEKGFRTEVMSLATTQNLKNAIITPNGAKGGFYIKNKSLQSVDCYKTFISSILEISDNYINSQDTKYDISYDVFDPYVVVAADKGTSSFSDIANELSLKHNFWLKDAFASGGSTGYSHKDLGITSLGAWETAKPRFKKLGLDFQKDEVTAVVIGSMAGDVSGNGMLQYKNIKIKAAFNSKHIFIDPNPNIEKSYQERVILFEKEAGWDQYDMSKISQGGGVFSRKLELIKLSKEMKEFLDLNSDVATPNEVIRKILSSKVDIIFSGGIGTYFKSQEESDSEIHDHANDDIRIFANKIHARMLIEGANLSITHKGRIEYAKLNGLVYGDFVDNAAGVTCSDIEVNMKILLNSLDLNTRNKLIRECELEVVDKILNILNKQSHAIQTQSDKENKAEQIIEISNYLHNVVKLNPEILVSKEEVMSRQLKNIKLITLPEIAIFISGLKLALKKILTTQDLSNYNQYLYQYFPKKVQHLKNEIEIHKLKQNILSTQIASEIVNKVGFDVIDMIKNFDSKDLNKFLS